MTKLLMRILGRLPLGWLQLISNKLRFAAAGAGVGFACILVFVQLGMMGAFSEATRISYTVLDADILISSSDANTLSDGSNVARSRMYQAMSVPGVREACPLYVGMTPWRLEDGTKIEFKTLGINPSRRSFVSQNIGDIDILKIANNVLLDQFARGMEPGLLSKVTSKTPVHFESRGHQLAIVGTISFGGGFAEDGTMVVSDQTFMRIFPERFSGGPNHILLKVGEGEDARLVAKQVREAIPAESLKIRSFGDAIDEDLAYQRTRRPTGLIFGFGVAIGIIVGIVIVYQILSTDVADHLREYATFKAMGYEQRYFRSIVLEEAVILAVVGFVPALLISLGIYHVMAAATGLPIAMTTLRAVMVFLGTVASCAASGTIALRKLANADPADLF